jgi:hypothetical protein
MKQYQYGVLLLAALAGGHQAAAQNAAFTGVGYLLDAGQPANGLYEVKLTIFDSPYGGRPLTPSSPFGDVLVREGVINFTMYPRSELFQPGRWLEVGVRRSGSTAPYTILSPRQPFVPNAGPVLVTGAGPAGLPEPIMVMPPVVVETVVVAQRPWPGHGYRPATVSPGAQGGPHSVPSFKPGQVPMPAPPHPSAMPAGAPAMSVSPGNMPPMLNQGPHFAPAIAPAGIRR